ncbi:siderophore-interacting protein [Propionicicella superfundia]|uniref:siderophore-interacting protein n=1 Tax=Propionicicella superfundia TaxID=348582 RepID=UPI00040727D6|nr:siderophore-interacting protein [Propionicicella superfundia]
MEHERRNARVWRVSVEGSEQVSSDLIRVNLTGPELAEFPDLPFTDHYVKLLFPPPGAPYGMPVDPDAVREAYPRELWPVMRTYTIRSFDRGARRMAIDFVVHGERGLAGPWAAGARPGDEISFRGPGGAWGPPPVADAVILAGDESALPAIAAALERLDPGVGAVVFAEVGDAGDEFALPAHPRAEVCWVHRDRGESLEETIVGADLPGGVVHAFVHGNADMMRPVRRHLLVERGLPRERTSISGYWRTGQTEDVWQATKREFNASLEADL